MIKNLDDTLIMRLEITKKLFYSICPGVYNAPQPPPANADRPSQHHTRTHTHLFCTRLLRSCLMPIEALTFAAIIRDSFEDIGPDASAPISQSDLPI